MDLIIITVAAIFIVSGVLFFLQGFRTRSRVIKFYNTRDIEENPKQSSLNNHTQIEDIILKEALEEILDKFSMLEENQLKNTEVSEENIIDITGILEEKRNER